MPEQLPFNLEEECENLLSTSDRLLTDLEKNYGGLTESIVELQQLLAGRPSLMEKYQARVALLKQRVADFENQPLAALPKAEAEAVVDTFQTTEDQKEEDQRRFDELRNNDPDFLRNPSLLFELGPLFDVAASTQAVSLAREKLETVYNDYLATKNTPSKVTSRQPARAASVPEQVSKADVPPPPFDTLMTDAEKRQLKKKVANKLTLYQSLATATELAQPDRISLINDAKSEDEAKLKKAENFLDKRIIELREAEVTTFNLKGDHYKVLGISRSAKSEEIAAVYRNLARKFHSDMVSDLSEKAQKKSEEIIRALNEIKRVLSDEQLKKAYDATLPAEQTVGGSETSRPESATTSALDLATALNNILNGRPANYRPGSPTPTVVRETQPKVDKVKTVEQLETELMQASNIKEMKGILRQLHERGYVFVVKDLDKLSSAGGFADKKFTVEELMQRINTAEKAMRNPSAFDLAVKNIQQIHSGIGVRVESELTTRRNALDDLAKNDANLFAIIFALSRLVKMGTIGVLINDEKKTLDLVAQHRLAEQISRNKFDPTTVNRLITQLTPWNNLDLKVYYDVRQGDVSRNWQNAPIPSVLATRYEKYQKSREGS